MVAHNLRHLHYKYHSSKSLKSSRLVRVFKLNRNKNQQVVAAICNQRLKLSCKKRAKQTLHSKIRIKTSHKCSLNNNSTIPTNSQVKSINKSSFKKMKLSKNM